MMIDPSQLIIERTLTPKAKTPQEKLTFGSTFSDHMLEINWTQSKGWESPIIKPYGDLTISPAASVLHYGVECFEGMKAYADEKDQIRLFRPELNMERFQKSMLRLCLPKIDTTALLQCIKALITIDKDWVPRGDGYSMYIRPTAIGTNGHVGVGKPTEAKVFVILCPVGPYYPEGFDPIKLYAEDQYVRAWPGGTGNYKIGGNYAPTILPQNEVKSKGYSQILWLFGPKHEITEVGTMNLFIFWINESGEKELITCPLSRGDILPGITRQSVLECCRQWGEFQVNERLIQMKDIVTAVKEKRLIEIFGTGTAAAISPVSTIHYQDNDLEIPLDGKDGKTGKLAMRLWYELMDIQYGRKQSEWSQIIA